MFAWVVVMLLSAIVWLLWLLWTGRKEANELLRANNKALLNVERALGRIYKGPGQE